MLAILRSTTPANGVPASQPASQPMECLTGIPPLSTRGNKACSLVDDFADEGMFVSAGRVVPVVAVRLVENHAVHGRACVRLSSSPAREVDLS